MALHNPFKKAENPIEKQPNSLPLTSRRDFLHSAGTLAFGAVGAQTFLPETPASKWEETERKEYNYTLPYAESFPTLATDGQGRTWLAVLARPLPHRQVQLFLMEGTQRIPAGILEPQGTTGVGAPVLVPLLDGVFLGAPIEDESGWRIAWTKVSPGQSGLLPCQYLDAGGNTNTAVAAASQGSRVMVVWEANPGGTHGIFAAAIAPDNSATSPQRLTASKFNCCQPDVVSLADGRFFAAWDSFRYKNVNLFGAWFENGEWKTEKQITDDSRIERHVRLASHEREVWLAWQAQTFPENRVNFISEQRVAVARLTPNGLMTPPSLFDEISSASVLNMRPWIGFDQAGCLWLTARRSMGTHNGWQPMAWHYDGRQWSAPQALRPDQGRWQVVPLAFGRDGIHAACQHDDLPTDWNVQTGIWPDWHSEVAMVNVDMPKATPSGEMNLAQLAMPATDFTLAAHLDGFSLSLPRQTMSIGDQRLSLYWGDLHNHTDLSVCQRSVNPPIDDLYANQRDIEQLDFTAITDHGYSLDHPQWQYNGEQVRAFYDPEHFVTLLGQEWTSDKIHYHPSRPYRRYGHRNLIFENVFYDRFCDADDGDITPQQVWDQLQDQKFISIPHQLADTQNCPTDWTYHDEHHQPIAEIFQHRQSYEYFGAPRQSPIATPFPGHFLQDAWALGIVIGVSASPDHGGGEGKTGVWAESLTREDLFKAFHARHTFGTTGVKIGLFVNSDTNLMGDKVLRAATDPIPLHIHTVADRPIKRIVILRNNVAVIEKNCNTAVVDWDWQDDKPIDEKVAWYYVRVHREDEELAWSSPIWFFKTQADLDATVGHAHNLTKLYPDGVPIPKHLPPFPPLPKL